MKITRFFKTYRISRLTVGRRRAVDALEWGWHESHGIDGRPVFCEPYLKRVFCVGTNVFVFTVKYTLRLGNPSGTGVVQWLVQRAVGRTRLNNTDLNEIRRAFAPVDGRPQYDVVFYEPEPRDGQTPLVDFVPAANRFRFSNNNIQPLFYTRVVIVQSHLNVLLQKSIRLEK